MHSLAKFNNRLRMVAAYHQREARTAFLPQEVVLELTNHCNLACVMCPHRKMTRPRGYMAQGLFAKIIDEICQQTDLVYLHGTGESLLHKGLADYIAYARSRGLTTCLSTNGMLLDETASQALLTSGLDFLIVAMDGGTKETYESIRIKGDFEKLTVNIRGLLNTKARLGSATNICLQMIYMPKNAHEIDLFQSLFTRRQRRLVNQMRFKPLFETYALSDAPVKHTRPCYWLWNMLFVAWDGQVGLCCMDFDATYNLGDLRSQSVAEVWGGETVRELRRRHQTLDYDQMPLCRSCDIPQQAYFSGPTIAGSALLSAGLIRRIMPVYERLMLDKKRISNPRQQGG